MPAGNAHLDMGPLPGRPVSEAVAAGRLVEPTSGSNPGGTVKHAAAGSKKVLGMACTAAQPASAAPTDQVDPSFARPRVAIQYGPADVVVTYADAAAYGELLKAAADGKVTPMATGGAGTFDQVVGRCTQPGGMSAAGDGWARLAL